jgi:hypothetical protein
MPAKSKLVPVYLEVGSKRAFAGGLEWPGWCRAGRDGDAALAALVEWAPRYARVLKAAHIAFHAPKDVASLEVAERLKGDSTTDFGAPSIAPDYDAEPVDAAELKRLQSLLSACWAALDAAAEAAAGATLSKGPRGGGRDQDGIVKHALEAQRSYVGSLGGKAPPVDEADLSGSGEAIIKAALDALAQAAHGELPTHGPRGGARWSPRYFVRRSAWHLLDHAWELEDRSTKQEDR